MLDFNYKSMLKLNITIKNLPAKLGRVLKNLSTMSFETEKEKFLKMSSDEKKKFYKGDIITLDQVMTWPQYWKKNKESIKPIDIKEAEKSSEELANKISMWQGDITSLEIDAIVNAANSSLLGGGGVDGAIHRAAGPILKKECAILNECAVGEAKITGGYKLPAKYVIHTVGPQGEKPDKLKECYVNSIRIAKENSIKTIAFPCISTGVYGYPQKPAAKVAIETVKKYLQDNINDIDRIIFCLFLESDKEIYEQLLQKYFPQD